MSLWTQVARWVTHINMAPSGIMVRGHQHGFGLQHRPQTSAWTSVVTQTTNIYTDPKCNRATDSDVAGPQQQHRPRHPDIAMASGGSTGHLHHYDPQQRHGPRTSTCLQSVVQTVNIHMPSGDIMGHSGPLRSFNPESELFLILGLHCCPSQGDSTADGMSGGGGGGRCV